MKREWNGLLVVMWILVLVSALGVIFSTHRSRQLFDELQKLSREQNQLEVEWGRLLLERSTRSSLGTVDRMAADWGMREPLLNEIRVVQP